MMEKLQDMPPAAFYIIYGAGALVGLLLLVVLFLVISNAIKGGKGNSNGPRVKVPKNLPITPIQMMSDRESALYERLKVVIKRHPNYSIHAKVGTVALIGVHPHEHEKVIKQIEKKFINDVHDFVILDRGRRAIAIVELDSTAMDIREEQATQAGIPVIRINNPTADPDEIQDMLRRVLV